MPTGQTYTSQQTETTPDTDYINCIFENITGASGLRFQADRVRAIGCTFRNIGATGSGQTQSLSACRFSATVPTDGCQIIDCLIEDIASDGILVAQPAAADHTNLLISGCTIQRTGLLRAANAGYAGMHGIYLQATDAIVEGCTILDSRGGNGVSVRTAAWIRNNDIDGAEDGCITYFADHRGDEGSATLRIEGNRTANWNTAGGGTYNCITMLADPGTGTMIEVLEVRNNIAPGGSLVIQTGYGGVTQVIGNLVTSLANNPWVYG